MTKKHFQFMANYIKNLTTAMIPHDADLAKTKNSLALMAMKTGKEFNPNFDETVFLKACGLV
jgi:hypothetical protein